MKVLVTVIAAIGLCLPSTGCTDTSPKEAGPSGAATSPTASTSREVTVSVGGGRTIAGTCRGLSVSGSPTVVLVAGMGNPGNQLGTISSALEAETQVCSYDRPGLGSSNPVASKQTLGSVVDDLATFLDKGGIDPPYVLVGHSFGASEVIRYAQLHPDLVAGFVSMNPVPPYHEWLRRAGRVETAHELQSTEIDYYNGSNEESIDLTDTDLTASPIRDDIPYVVMQSENCTGDFCERIKPVLRKATEEILGHLGKGGRFLSFADKPHDLYQTNLPDVLREIRTML
jgi:pimeloyl-ACP methyl ester carboxylesterase